MEEKIGSLQARPAAAISARWWVIVLFVGPTMIGLLIFGHTYLDDLANGEPGEFWATLINELTGAYTGAALIPFLIHVARRYPLIGGSWARHLPAHLLALVVFSAVHTTLIFLARTVIYSLAGLGAYDYGILSIRYPMEFPNDVIAYCICVGVVYIVDRYREFRDREVRAAQLEARLSEAQLDVLRLQLEPHFLFNTLNTISSILYEDPRAADEMISRLSDLLRVSLRSSGSQEVALDEELRFLDLYLEIMRARFADRLSVTFEVEPAARGALVPYMLLQPLVENAIRHGADPHSSLVAVDVRAARAGRSLVIEVRDHGAGMTGGREAVTGNGIGLSNTAHRLAQLYGTEQELSLREAEGGGLLVAITVPFRTTAAVVATT
jgi:two-component system LytT family sensor kinase